MTGHTKSYDVVIVGGGAAGISVAAGLVKKKSGLNIALVEPSTQHAYQPGWTFVGAGIFDQSQTVRDESTLIPKGVEWVRQSVEEFRADTNCVVLDDGSSLSYRYLVAAPGLRLAWDKVAGLEATLGRNGVTSNYRYDLAPYTWQLVQEMKGGEALFTQPDMPIKCAGAPQKAMYLSCDRWRKAGVLNDINVGFHNAGGVLFGVAAYVPALMDYVKSYQADLRFNQNLIAIDGDKKEATFAVKGQGETVTHETRGFDFIHVCPPQVGHDFAAQSPLANAAGWIDVDQHSLRSTKFDNVLALGDATSTPNAKTAAAVRKQAPVVVDNLIALLEGREPKAAYNGYGACPLTVEIGKIVLAEFEYGGKVKPTFPNFINKGLQATARAWWLKEKLLPTLYYDWMLRGDRTLAKPETLTT